MRKTFFLLCAMMAAVLSGCSQKQEPKSIVIYFSVSGATETAARIIQQKTGADIEKIEAVTPYENDFGKIIEAYQAEMSQGISREIKPLKSDLSGYDLIYLGTPVWFGNCSGPVETFLKEYDLSGKRVVPFCTFGSGGNTAVDMIKRLEPGAEYLDWYGVRNARIGKAEGEIEAFLKRIGILEGTTESLPDFSAQREPSEQEIALFHEATDSYDMPMGTPVSVQSRDAGNATEYIFKSQSTGMDGNPSEQSVYVTKGKASGATAEFTQVDR